MAFLLNSQAQGVSGRNDQSTQSPWRRAPKARVPMQLHRLHQLKAGPANNLELIFVYPMKILTICRKW